MAPDQFSRTMRSDPVERIEQVDPSTTVNPVSPITGKIVERKSMVAGRGEHGRRHAPIYSELFQTVPELWKTVVEFVKKLNAHQDVQKLPFSLRVWAQNNGFRLQLIHNEGSELIKQTEIIPFKYVTQEDLNHIINSLISERGVVIDLMQ